MFTVTSLLNESYEISDQATIYQLIRANTYETMQLHHTNHRRTKDRWYSEVYLRWGDLAMNRLTFPNTLVHTNNQLTTTPTFDQLIAATKAVEAAWQAIYEQMDNYSVTSLKGDWGYATTGELKNWKTSATLPDEFYVSKLDTAKLNYMYKHGDDFPAGVDFSVTRYHRKGLK